MSSEMSPPPAPAGPPGRAQHRRLARSTHDRLWAGVAGGVAEYFDLDPSLVRLLFVLAAIVTWGAAVALYIAAWIILPRDDRAPAPGAYSWHDWSDEFHSETHRLAEEARRVADDARSRSTWQPLETEEPAPSRAATDKGSVPTPPPAPTAAAEPDPWWQSERYVERHRHNRHPRTAGIVLVTVGVLFLAANAGLFSWIEWKAIWPLFLIGLGLMLFARQGWR